MSDVNALNWLPIKIDDTLGLETQLRQFRFPRSKKRRIRNKWANQTRNFRTENIQKPVAYTINHLVVMNSAAFLEFKKLVDSQPLKRAIDYRTSSSMMLATIGQNLGLPVTTLFLDSEGYSLGSAKYDAMEFEMRVRHDFGPRLRS